MPDDSSTGAAPGLWRSLRALLFGGDKPETLRTKLEEAIDEADEDAPRPAKDDLSANERQMVRNLLHFGERDAGDVGVPRADIIGVEEQTSFADLIKRFAEAGHSRLPVYRGDMDTVVGMVHVKDVFNIVATGQKYPRTLAPLIRQPLFVPMSRGVLDLLADMRASRTHLAIVIDEYSGTEGLVTIEDLIEEIVGDIEDEHDEAPEAMLVPLDGGAWDADARIELEDVGEQVDPHLSETEGDVDTLGGLAFLLAGHVPAPGECLEHPSGWRIEVTAADERRVTRVRLYPPKPVEEEVEANG